MQLVHVEPGHPRWPSFEDWIGAHPDTDPKLRFSPPTT
jgi:hypothetical protein